MRQRSDFTEIFDDAIRALVNVSKCDIINSVENKYVSPSTSG